MYDYIYGHNLVLFEKRQIDPDGIRASLAVNYGSEWAYPWVPNADILGRRPTGS